MRHLCKGTTEQSRVKWEILLQERHLYRPECQRNGAV